MKIEVLSDYNIRYSDQFFFDTNIWIYLLYPQQGVSEKYINQYSDFYSKILTKDKLIATDLLQISELINAIINIEYRKYSKQEKVATLKLKEWKETSSFTNVLKELKIITDNLLRNTTLVSGIFNDAESKDLVSDCDKADFNDLYFVRLAEKQRLNIVTHDFDFKAAKNFSFSIISANTKFYN